MRPRRKFICDESAATGAPCDEEAQRFARGKRPLGVQCAVHIANPTFGDESDFIQNVIIFEEVIL